MAEAETIDGADGLPGELVHQVAERLKEANDDLERYGYHLALVPDEGPPTDGVPLGRVAEASARAARGAGGHWAEVEVRKLPNEDLSIRLRGYRETPGSEDQARMAELVRALLREALV